MKKKNLAILLVMPFLLALFGIAAIKTAFNIIDNDVIWIEWSYDVQEFFEVGKEFRLKADTVVLSDNRYPASDGNRLVWKVENTDPTDMEEHAAITTDGDGVGHLVTISEGDITIYCTTEKGNYGPKKIEAFIHGPEGAFVINTVVGGSDQRIDPTLYFGEYDLVNGKKQQAVIDIKVKASSQSIFDGLVLDTETTSDNLTVDLDNGKIYINSVTDELSIVKLKNDILNISTVFSFQTIKDGINVYSYDDLLYCTNKSKEGEIAVLRTHFQNKEISDLSKANNVNLFGTSGGSGYNFADEVYTFHTTYNSEYINMWNRFVNNEGGKAQGYDVINDIIVAGLHVQKDFYGNGYTLNLHELCFPTSYSSELDDMGNTYEHYSPGKNDLFRGPKPFYLLGDPNSSVPLVTAYGQDNIGMYVDGDNITVNDIQIQNCANKSGIRNNLDYVGTVMEISGSNNTVKNSQMSFGKNIMRAFSSMNLTVDNCMLATSRNFLLNVGTNEYEKNGLDDTTLHEFVKLDGTIFTGTLNDYLETEGDVILNLFTTGYAGIGEMTGEIESISYTRENMKAALHSLQQGLNRMDVITSDAIKGSVNINNTYFSDSGIASIGVETMFNGPFLFNNKPSMLEAILGLMGSFLETAIPKLPDNISGASYPVAINISGDTKFFDYKDVNKMDISGLIDQHISEVAGGLIGNEKEITIDQIFPLKSILTRVADNSNSTFTVDGNKYINIPVAFYGGGGNLSTVTTEGLTSGGFTHIQEVDLLDSYLSMSTKIDLRELFEKAVGGNDVSLKDILAQDGFMTYMRETMTKAVTTVIGFESFKFQFINSPDGLYKDGKFVTPGYQDLQKRA